MQSGRTSPRPRERIVSTARDLFHRRGIRAVGIDTIAEVAGTNKTTLYRHFISKDDLIMECLRSRAEEARQSWAEIEASSPEDGLAQLRFWLARVAKRLANDCRGCEFTNAAVELTEEDHPARKFIEDIKTEYRDWLAKLCRKAGIARAELLADTLSILLEGARASRQSVGPEGPSSRFLAMAEAIIESFRR
ncbi:MAG TPA: TetR/AcrR family transcriptional regulator [Blastocatellia bacterium]|jgi:AcrR family transcriptional regulator|nr:TetR/AcrR family transcriptional regulator [Blastocatellia bacterium]